MAIRFTNGFGIGASNNGGGGGGPVVNCSPTSTFTSNVYYTSGTTLTWTDDTTGYSLYTGGFTNPDEGYSTNPIILPSNFFMSCTGSTKLYISTNGYISFETPNNGNGFDGPQGSYVVIAGNPGDLYINPGDSLTDGTTQNVWYKITNDGNFMKVELKIFMTHYQNQGAPTSFQLNLYKDSTYQWIETFVKSNTSNAISGPAINCGPTSSPDASQPTSTTSKVWRGELGGSTWTYIGEGSVTDVSVPTPITGGYYNSGVSVSSNYNPYGPGSSYVFNGSNGYITLTGNTDTAFGTGDFTVEWYQFENVHNSHPRIFAIGNYPSATLQVSLESGSFYVMENSGWRASPSYGYINQTWVHFAIVRISNTTTIYKDGNSIYSYSDSYDLNNTSTDLHIGQESPVSDSGAYFNGAITSFRWTKGLGIYTGNFQKPTGPLSLTASANPFGGSNTSAISAGYVKYLLQP